MRAKNALILPSILMCFCEKSCSDDKTSYLQIFKYRYFAACPFHRAFEPLQLKESKSFSCFTVEDSKAESR